MDLFGFVRQFDPTKMRMGDRELAKREVKLLTWTKGRTVSLNPPASAASGDSSDNIDKLFDEGEVVVEKTKKKQKRKATRDVSSSTLSPKKLKEDYHARLLILAGSLLQPFA
nr:hypothetical protein [Tanacetum cinerariifolium]